MGWYGGRHTLADCHSFRENVLPGKVNAVIRQVNALVFPEGCSLIWVQGGGFSMYFYLKTIRLLKESE